MFFTAWYQFLTDDWQYAQSEAHDSLFCGWPVHLTSDAETEVHLPEVHREITCGLDTSLVWLEPEIGYF